MRLYRVQVLPKWIPSTKVPLRSETQSIISRGAWWRGRWRGHIIIIWHGRRWRRQRCQLSSSRNKPLRFQASESLVPIRSSVLQVRGRVDIGGNACAARATDTNVRNSRRGGVVALPQTVH
jgi:hypothetical protein